MKINFSPVRSDIDVPEVKCSKDALTIDGELFDFAPVPEGATLPAEAIGSAWFIGPVQRIGGEIVLTLRLPHGPSPSEAVAFPDPISVTKAGVVKLPSDPAPLLDLEELPLAKDVQEAQ